MPNQEDNNTINQEIEQLKKETEASIVKSIGNMLGISSSGDVASLAYNINNIVFSELIIKYNGNTEEIKKALNKPINLKGAFGILGISTVFGIASFSDIKLDEFSGASIDKYYPKPNKNWAAFWLKTLATGAASIAVGGWNIGGIGTKIFAGVSVDAIFKKVYDRVVGPHVMTIDFTKTPDPNDTVAMERKYIVREGSLEDTLKHNWDHINSDMKNLERVIVNTEDLGKSNIIYYRKNEQKSILNDTLYLEKWNSKGEENLISFLKRFDTDFLPKIKRGNQDSTPKELIANYFANFGAEASRVESDLRNNSKTELQLAAAYALEHLAGYVLKDHKAPNEYTKLEPYSQQHLRDRAEFLTVKIKTTSGSNDRSISKMFYDQRTGEGISGDAPAKFGLQKNLVAFVDGKYKAAYQSSLRTIYGYSNDDTIESTWISNNYIESGLGSDTIITGSGNDTIYTNADIDGKYDQEDNGVKNTVHAGAGDDTVYGSKGMDEIYGEGGSDTIYGGGGDDIIYGGEDNDTLYADNAARGSIDTSSNINKLYGGQGDDTIIGGAGKDYLYANDEKGDSSENHMTNDSLDGKEGDDFLYGNTAKQSRTIMQGGTGNDTFYGGQGGIDTMNDEEGDDTYYAGDWDTINDSDGIGKVFFGNELLTGGMYDKEKRAYVDRNNPKITYKLSEGEKILTVYKGIEKLKIKNYHKEDKSLGIKLANSKIEVSVTNKEGSANWLKESLGDTGLPFTLSLNRKLDKGEYLKVEVVTSMKGNKSIIEFEEGDISKNFNFTWDDDNYPQGNRSFVVNASVVDESSDLTAEVVSNARGMIKDDDRNPNYPNNPDVPTDPNDPENTPVRDPIIIDLNRDGTSTSKLNGAVNFDIDNNGFKEATGWISKDDAFLAYDRNGNGIIDNGNELFGDKTVSVGAYGYTSKTAENGFEALKEFDSNNDNIIDEKDKDFDKLLLWQDLNTNGLTEKGELKTLKEHNIKSIDLRYKETQIDNNGNLIKQTSTVTFNDNTTTTADDVWFKVDLRYTEQPSINIPERIKALPEVTAFGNLYNLRNAMSENSGLENMIKDYISLSPEEKAKQLDNVLFKWAGVEGVDKDSRGQFIDARILGVYEKISGKPFLQWGNNPNPSSPAANIIMGIMSKFKNYVYANIELQTKYKGLIDTTYMYYNDDTNKYDYDFSKVNARLKELYNAKNYKELSVLTGTIRDGVQYKSELLYSFKNNLENLVNNNSDFALFAISNYMSGTDKDDVIQGKDGHNLFIGGKGNDIFRGGYGKNAYIYHKGDGSDTIYESGGESAIYFEDIRRDEVEFSNQDGSGLNIKIKGTQDSINIKRWYAHSVNQIPFKFADGFTMSSQDLRLAVTGDESDNTLYGYQNNDTIEGGKGNDKLNGEYGDDTYIYSKGDGNDVISDWGGANILYFKNLSYDGVKFFRQNSNLLIKIKDTGETIIINEILSYSSYATFRFKFSDGTIKDGSNINLAVVGDDKDNTLYGFFQENTIMGGKGNDTLYGRDGEGVDTYVYNKGDGNDTIYDYRGKNTLEFKDINKDGVEFSTEGKDLLITVKDTQEYITIKDIFWRNNEFYFKFADGNTIGIGDLVLAFTGDDQDNTLNGHYGNDILEGKKGNDKLYGKEGDDTYVYRKGDGNDIIYDWQGNNTVDFKDIISSEVSFIKENSNLLVKIRDTNEQITIANFFNGYSSNMNFKFTDGVIVDNEGAKAAVLIGDDNSNSIQGYDSKDILKGNGGNDTIYGGKGDDGIEGGAGNDILVGNEGVDTYVFGRGDGQDVIYALDADYGRFNIDANGNYNISYYYNQQNVKGTDIIKFKEGITRNDLILERAGANGHDLLIKIKDTNDSITVKDMFSDDVSSRGIDKIEFADGSFMSTDDIYKNTPLAINRADQERTNGSVYSDTIIGNDQNNTAYGKDGNDVIHGHEGDDKLYGDAGNDTLIGGKGNDYLDGGNGSDVYVYNKGDGNDTISDTNGTDAIKFGSGISKQDIIVKRTNVENAQDYRNITISFKDSPNDSITILDVSTGNTTNDSNIIETFEFENGEKLSFEDIKKLSLIGSNEDETLSGYNYSSNIIKGNGGDDTLYGQEGNDTIDGGEGNDIIEGGSGNDTLIGGAGNDTLNGGIGDNVYVYNKGDGNDTIVDTGGTDIIKFGQGINKEDLVATKSGDEHYKDITLTFKNSPSDSIVIKEVFIGENIKANNKIETLEFANGERLKIEDIKLNIIGSKENDDIRGYNDFSNIIKGNGGDDTLYGGDGNDIIEGGSGNDTLYGGDGEDTYAFARGDGQDTIVYSDGKDIIKFKSGIAKDDLIFKRITPSNLEDNLMIRIKDTKDSILIKNMFDKEGGSSGVKGLKFDDGSFMSFNEIRQKALMTPIEGDGLVYGFDSDDTIMGGDGDNQIYGKSGNDTLYGGKGNDELYGEAGDDTLYGGEGNDILSGGSGDDTLYGGEGNDTLHGEEGADTYVLGKGDGNDKVYSDENDTIKLKDGIARDDINIQKLNDRNLKVSIKQTGDSVTVYDIFNQDYPSKIGKIEFSDGSFIDFESIKQIASDNTVYYADDNNNRLDGSDKNDIMYGDKDTNYIHAGAGNDILIGGEGNDELYGEWGADTYIFGKGDGQDTIYADGEDIIKFKEGITRDDILITRYYNDLVIKLKDSDDSVRISYMLYGSDDDSNDNPAGIKAIEFSDGSSLGLEYIRKIALANENSIFQGDNVYGFSSDDIINGSAERETINARSGNDVINGKGGNDTIIGSKGDDTLIGGEGDDIYEYYLGDGSDTIDNTGGGNDTLLFAYDISKNSISYKKDNNDLLMTINNDPSQAVRIKNHFLGGDYAIDRIEFGQDGSYADQEYILKQINAVRLSSEGGNNYLSDKDKKDNIYTYTGGKVTISDNGGDDRVVFKLDNPGDGLFYLSNGRDLKISTNKIDASNNDVLEIKNFFVNRSSIIENFDINDYWSVTAQSIYEQYGKTFPPEAPDTPPSNPGGSDDSSLTGGSEDNVFNYKGGMVSITDTGGNDKVIFKNPGSRVFYSSDGIDLMISTAKIDSSNNNILQVKNFFASKDSIIETFQINDYWSVTAQSIYKAFGKTYPNQTAPVNNNPTTPPNSDNLIGGNEDNVFTYTGGKKSITDTGGKDKVIFAKQGSNVFYSSDGINLKISTSKINSSNKDVLEVKNFFSDKNAIIEEFQISDYWTVTAESIYQAFGKTYPKTQKAPAYNQFTANNINGKVDINRLIQDINSYSNNSSITSSSSDILRNDNSITLAMNQGV